MVENSSRSESTGAKASDFPWLRIVQRWRWTPTRHSVLFGAIALAAIPLLASMGQALLSAQVYSSGVAYIWDLSRHPLWIAVIAWSLAAWYQTRTKRSEFRFETFDRCAQAQSELLEAAWLHFRAKTLERALHRPGIKVRPAPDEIQRQLQDAERRLDAAFMRANPLSSLCAVLFSEKTQKHWHEMLRRHTTARFDEGLMGTNRALEEAGDCWGEFVRAAAVEIPLPFTEVAMPTSGLEEVQKETEGFLRKIEPEG